MDVHNNHHLQQPQPPPPPPAAPLTTHKSPVDQDIKRRPLVPLSFPNGTLKKHRPLYPLPPPLPPHRPASPPHGSHVVYRECMKNHAASLGGHALDGCGEFMPSPDASHADPASLTCAACGCHRNFHRRVLHGVVAAEHHHHYHPHREEREVEDRAAEDDDGDEAMDEEEDRHSTPPPQQPPAAAHQYYSAPHMLMALSAGLAGGPVPLAAGTTSAATQVAGGTNPAAMGSLLPRKRFRSKFSPDQKERMHELSERLGWRMQKRDDALVEQCCREIGVSRGVFKVWMHNNKHNFVGGPSSRRAGGGVGGGGGGGEATSSSGGIMGGLGAAGVNGGDEPNGVGDVGGEVGGDHERNGGSGGHGMNGSSPSS